MIERTGHIGRFFVALVALLTLLAGVPFALIAASRRRLDSSNPLADVAWPWQWQVGEIGDALTTRLTDDTVVDLLARVAIVVVWVSLGVIVVTTALEVAHVIRHRGLSMPAVRGLGWAQPIARFLAAGLLVLVPLTSPKTALAVGAGTSAAHAVAAVGHGVQPEGTSTTSAGGYGADEFDSLDVRAPSRAEQSPGLHVVQRGESIYGIAESLAAELPMSTGEVADRILDANLGTLMASGQRFTNPAYIEVGWELVVPADVLPPTRSAAPTQDRDSTLPADDEPAQHLVVPGDTLSAIAEEHLGDSASWPSIFAQNAGRDMGDGRTFIDPNVIVPGWTIDIPDEHTDDSPPVAAPSDGAAIDPDAPIDLAPTTVEPEIAAPDPLDVPTADEPTADAADAADAQPRSNAPAAEPTATEPELPELVAPNQSSSTPESIAPSPTLAPSPAQPTSPTLAPSTTQPTSPTQPTSTTSTTSTTTPAIPASRPATVDSDGGTTSSAPAPIRVEHAALLAAGVLALVGVRRRQRLRAAAPRARVPEPPASVVSTERRLRQVDPGERSTRVDVAIRAVAHELVDARAQVGMLLLGPDGDIEIRLTAPAALHAPWEAIDDGFQSWSLPASIPIEILGETARRVGTPCVALVQLGMTGNRDVVVDLEACGALAVDSPQAQADEVIAALAAGLATSPYAEIAHVITVALDQAAVFGHRNAHHVASPAAALELATSLVGTAAIADRSTFSLRSLRTGGEMWEPAIVLVAGQPTRDAAALFDRVPGAGHGIGVVAAVRSDECLDVPARLVGRPHGWTFVAFGTSIDLTPVGVATDDLAALSEMLDDAAAPLTFDEPLTWAPDVSTSTAVLETFEPMDHQIIVRLMGGVDVVSVDGQAGGFERSKTVELIAWLATHRHASTRSAARTALWELDVRDATFANVVSEARRGLGRLVPPLEDEEWLARTLTDQLPLHRGVVTDADLIEERLAAARVQAPAQAVATLRPAAELIRDMPFAGTGYLWPDAEGITSNLVLLATGVAAELAGHALSLGDIDLVFWATGQGLKVLAGHEELIGLRMRAHARAGDLAGVRQEWESYERVIVADAWSDGEPAPKLLALRRELLTSPT